MGHTFPPPRTQGSPQLSPLRTEFNSRARVNQARRVEFDNSAASVSAESSEGSAEYRSKMRSKGLSQSKAKSEEMNRFLDEMRDDSSSDDSSDEEFREYDWAAGLFPDDWTLFTAQTGKARKGIVLDLVLGLGRVCS